MAHLGATIEELAPGPCVLTTAFDERLAQHNGFFHAGVSAAIGDSAGGYAGLTLFGADADVLTVEFKINLLRPAAGDRLWATGNVLRVGRRLTTCEVRARDRAGRPPNDVRGDAANAVRRAGVTIVCRSSLKCVSSS